MKRVKDSTGKRAAMWAGLWTAGCFFCAGADLDRALPTAASSPAKDVLTIPLEYREVSFSPMNVGLAITPQAAAFKKEPQLGKSTVRRGRLFLPDSDSSLAFLWDWTRGKLYLDLNRNDDLTDDPAAVFSSGDSTRSVPNDYNFGHFRNVPLMLPLQSGQMPWLVDLNFSEYRSRLNVYASVRSFFAGKAVLAGHEYQAGWLPALSRRLGVPKSDYFLIRDWSEREERFSIADASLATVPLPKLVFLQSATYELTCAHIREGDNIKHLITFREQSVDLGELNISGRFIQRLVLTDGPCVAVLDSPDGTVRVPVGQYGSHRVQLGKGDSLAYLQRSPNPFLLVAADQPARLFAGGPLTNSATFSRRGNDLVLNYQLLGAGGGIYALAARDLQHPPRFTVYQGDRQIGSGKFEFG